MQMATVPKVWFITGASKGFGHEWSIAALERGDSVAATARDVATLDDLVEAHGDRVLPLTLDVTDRAADFAAVAQAHGRFGRLDVVVNNAGYGQFGMVEELSEDDARAQIEANLFGALWVTQAALPFMREQGSGRILQVSSIGGVTAFPNVGMYHASKWGLEGLSQSLAQEVAAFGIKVTLIEPTAYSTDWAGPSARHAEPLAAYDSYREGPRGGPPAAHRVAGRPRRHARGRARGRRRRGPAAADLLRRRAAGHRHSRLRVAPGHLARVGARVDRGAGTGLSGPRP
jgi:NAD(P)-dependent dehydrogenase (short-subunit alcohol dehydrogenase family)